MRLWSVLTEHVTRLWSVLTELVTRLWSVLTGLVTRLWSVFQVKVTIKQPNSEAEKYIRTLHKGDFFGEKALQG
jgi:hypothetical protein